MQAWKDDGYVGLRALLNAIEANDWTWHLDEFYGTAVVGSGINVLELENRLRDGDSLSFTWNELLVFADKVHQMIDGRLSAFPPGEDEPVLIVEARDSTDWVATARDHNTSATAAADRLAALNH